MKTTSRRLNRSIPYSIGRMQPSSLMPTQYQNWSCVIDPAIALSHYGVLIAENMGKEIESWVVQELWNIVNNAEFYSQRPELITPQIQAFKDKPTAETVWSLKEWGKIKQEQDIGGLGLYWLGDNLQESFLPYGKSVKIFERWEALAGALERRNEQTLRSSDVMTIAFRDTIALAASLKSAFILTYQLPSEYEKKSPPTICKVLETWGIPSQALNKKNPTVAIERQHLQQLIVNAGLSKLLLAGVHLAAFHLVLPPVTTGINLLSTSSESLYEQESYFWNNVKGIWYYL